MEPLIPGPNLIAMAAAELGKHLLNKGMEVAQSAINNYLQNYLQGFFKGKIEAIVDKTLQLELKTAMEKAIGEFMTLFVKELQDAGVSDKSINRYYVESMSIESFIKDPDTLAILGEAFDADFKGFDDVHVAQIKEIWAVYLTSGLTFPVEFDWQLLLNNYEIKVKEIRRADEKLRKILDSETLESIDEEFRQINEKLQLNYEQLLQDEYSDENWGELSNFVRILLLEKQQEWGISAAEAEIIEERVLQYRSKLLEYEQGLTSEIQKQYPLSAEFQAKLTDFQKYFKLRDEDIAEIHRRVLPQASLTQQNPAPPAIPTAPSAPIPKPSAIEPPSPKQTTIPLSTFSFETAQVKLVSGEIEITKTPSQAQHFVEDLGNGVTLEIVYIPGGQFMMGSDEQETLFDDERPQHTVNVPALLMSKYPITQAQYLTIVGSDPSHFKGSQRPVESVSWDDAHAFCQKLAKQTNRAYRLPSEAEWEYACRAGTKTPFYCGGTISPDVVNYDGNYPYYQAPKGYYHKATTDVGIFLPNSFGLYDLHGNMWEWCEDTWHENYQGAPTDGSPWLNKNNYRVLRGGSWVNRAWTCRSASRSWTTPVTQYYTVGFRLALSLNPVFP